MYKVLVIDECVQIRENIAELLELEHFKVMTAAQGGLGYQLAKENQFDIILCDRVNPLSGGNLLEVMFDDDQVIGAIPVVWFVTDTTGDHPKKISCKKTDALLQKPFSGEELMSVVQHLLMFKNNGRDVVANH